MVGSATIANPETLTGQGTGAGLDAPFDGAFGNSSTRSNFLGTDVLTFHAVAPLMLASLGATPAVLPGLVFRQLHIALEFLRLSHQFGWHLVEFQ